MQHPSAITHLRIKKREYTKQCIFTRESPKVGTSLSSNYNGLNQLITWLNHHIKN